MAIARSAPSGRAVLEWAGPLSFVVLTAALMVLQDAGPGTALRHLDIIPTVWAALRFGLGGGIVTASLVVVLDAPFLLKAIETWGLDRAAVEGAVTLGLLVLLGVLAGSLTDQARRQRARYEAVLGLQRALSASRPLAEGLELTNRALRTLFRAETVEAVVRRDDGTYLGANGPRCIEPGTAGAWVATHGKSLYLPDAGGATASGRPRRVVVVPLVAGRQLVGIAGAERAAGFSRDDRAALETLGAQIALAIENAWLKNELESKVAAATRRLSELDRAKSELVSIASHELRTPLTSLRGFSELLLARRYGTQETRRFISVIHTEAERLGRILDNLLDLARIERGQGIEARPVAVAIRPLLESQVESWQAQGARRRFVIVVPPDLPPLLVDRDAIERILTNLVSNAVKYSPAGSEIRLVARGSAGESVEVSVEDEGEGIPEDALPRIFDLYYRVARRNSTARGLGLGLALVRSLAEANGGTIRVESSTGAGSRFTVSLPCGS